MLTWAYPFLKTTFFSDTHSFFHNKMNPFTKWISWSLFQITKGLAYFFDFKSRYAFVTFFRILYFEWNVSFCRNKLSDQIHAPFLIASRIFILDILLTVFDIGSDFANGANYISSGHTAWGAFTIFFIFLPGWVSQKLAFF